MGCIYLKPVSQRQPKQVTIKNNIHQNSLCPITSGQMLIEGKQNKNNHIVPDNLKELSEQIMDKFSVVEIFLGELAYLAYTEKFLIQCIQAFLKCITKIGDGESIQDKASVQNLFSPATILDIKLENKFFIDFLSQFQKTKKEEQIKQFCKSRIYHEIANIKKEIKIENNIENKFGLSVQKSYEYNYLSDRMMDEVVKLQHVGKQIQKLGQTIKSKLDSVRKQTEAITLLLGNIFAKYADSISKLKYDLSIEEAMLVADIARQACDYYQNGVYLLVVYFVRSCKCLQRQNQQLLIIQDKLNFAISQIQKKYLPEQNFSQEDLKYKERLQKIQQKGQLYTHSQILKPNENQQQLESMKQNATIFQQCKSLFQNLVKYTCLDDYVSQKATITSTKGEQLKKQEKIYKKKISQMLKDQKQGQFRNSDILKGKRLFSSIEDILQTVYKIKNYVADNSKDYRLIEVESRFIKETPISDVVVKIVIKQKIIAELQLTLQTNSATYTFARKIFQFSGSKVFSKIKVVDNYYKQFESQFTTMVGQMVKLAESHNVNQHANRLINIKQYAQKIRGYFSLKQEPKSKSFRQLLVRELRKAQYKIDQGVLWANEQLQDLILPIFCFKIGEWGSQLGNRINTIILKQNHSPIFKSTLIYFLYSHIDVEEHFQSIKQFQNKRKRQIMQKLDYTQWKEQHIRFQEYIENRFEVKGVRAYHDNTARLFYQFKNLSTMIDCTLYQGKIRYTDQYQINRIFGQNSEQTVLFLLKFAKACFLRKKYVTFQYLCSWLTNLVQKLNAKESQNKDQYIVDIKLLIVQDYLQQNKTNEAKQLLEKIIKIIKSFKKPNYQKEIECELMLVECKINQIKQSSADQNKDYIEDYKKSYRKVLEKAQAHEISCKGRIIADSEWRIAEKLWRIAKQTNNINMQRETLDKHYRRAIVLSSADNVEKCVIMSATIPWDEFKMNQLPNPQLRENILTVCLDLSSKAIRPAGWEVLKEANITKLQQLFMEHNSIGSFECRHLSGCNWPNLLQLNIGYNSIKSQGCKHLTKARWPNLRQLNLEDNQIGSQGCKHLCDCNWPNLSQLNLEDNLIGSQGCEYLRDCYWPNLRQLNLGYNSIKSQGCEHIRDCNWPNFSKLNLEHNLIGSQGCEHLAKASWPNLNQLDLRYNLIGSQGCKHLKSANWTNLRQLNLQRNLIGSQGCQHLRKANWPKLSQLNIKLNQLQSKDKQALQIAPWPRSISLDI